MQKGLEEISRNGKVLAIIVYSALDREGINFFTPNSWSQQLAYMQYPPGKIIDAHTHNPVRREVLYTQEVLFIRKGKLRVDLYSEKREYLESRILGKGDTIMLATGGHGFEVLEELEMIEVKQGPYIGDQDKTRFPSVSSAKIKLGT